MDLANAERIARELPEGAKVLDVGGGASAYPRADYVLDFLSYDERGTGSSGNVHLRLNQKPRYNSQTWIKWDVCERRRWPFQDKAFDYAVCSHLLEDVRDPVWVCTELQRVAKAGYIETPSRTLEQCLGVEHPRYAGYYHHRWLISARGSRLEFRHKPHNLHVTRDAIVAALRPGRTLNPASAIITLEWSGGLDAAEVYALSESDSLKELCEFAESARCSPGLIVREPIPFRRLVRKQLYWRRLAHGARI